MREDLEPALVQFVQRATRDRISDLESITRVNAPLKSGTYAMVGATIVDGTNRPPVSDGVVLVRDGLIADAGSARVHVGPQLVRGLLGGALRAVRTRLAHRLIAVGGGEQARLAGDPCPRETAGVPGAVEAFPVLRGDPGHGRERLRLAEHSAEPSVNTARPRWNERRRPERSAMRPAPSSRAPNTTL